MPYDMLTKDNSAFEIIFPPVCSNCTINTIPRRVYIPNCKCKSNGAENVCVIRVQRPIRGAPFANAIDARFVQIALVQKWLPT